MRSSGGAVIRMQQNSDVEYVVGSQEMEASLPQVRALRPFSEPAVAFLEDLSRRCMRDAAARAYPDVVTFGFWCRRAALMQRQAMYDDLDWRLGRGVTFHVAPSNVAVNFAYSCAAALLAGNASIVRLPSKDFPQVKILCRLWRDALTEHPELQAFFLFVRYGHLDEVNARYSLLADTRVVWGGDETIRQFRRYPLQPRANEILFADRFSLAILDAEEYLACEDKDAVAQDFYNDTYLSDQQACTSPHLVVWWGQETDRAREEFWRRLHERVGSSYELLPVQVVDKLDALLRLGAEQAARRVRMSDTLIMRAEVAQLTEALMDVRTGSGFFVEYVAKDLLELRPVLGMATQTISYFGSSADKILAVVQTLCPRGGDRIVPLGKTLEFSLFWDGYDLIRGMSRRIGVL